MNCRLCREKSILQKYQVEGVSIMPDIKNQHVTNKRINPFTGCRTNDVGNRYSVRLETLAGKRPLLGLIKFPINSEGLTIFRVANRKIIFTY